MTDTQRITALEQQLNQMQINLVNQAKIMQDMNAQMQRMNNVCGDLATALKDTLALVKEVGTSKGGMY